jgi:hypothetical protein
MRGAWRSRFAWHHRSGLAGFSDRQQTGPFVSSQFTFARWAGGVLLVPVRGSASAEKFPTARPSLIPPLIGELFPIDREPEPARGVLSGGQQQQLAIARPGFEAGRSFAG